MTTSRIVACEVRSCKWFRGPLGPLEYPVFICRAFPKGIPEKILSGRDLHNEPTEGDDGIHFELGIKE